jgi:hypothetical protein
MEHVTTPVAALVEAIEKMLADPAVLSIPGEYLTDGPAEDLHPVVNEVSNFFAPEALIKPNGHPDFEAHRALAAAGYKVSCGERDSFGWLTGVITTPKGLIVYG